MVSSIDASEYGWLTLQQFAEREDVGEDWVRKLCKDKRLAGAHKAGGVWFIHRDATLPDKRKRGRKGAFDPVVAQAEYDAWVTRMREVEGKYAKAEQVAALNPRQQAMMDWMAQGYAMREDGLRSKDGEEPAMIAGWTDIDWAFWQLKRGRVSRI